MVREGSVPSTPEELDAWIAGAPDAREPLERGGYGRDFAADDLLPLLHVFAAQAGGAAPSVAQARTTSWNRWALAVALLAVVVVLIALAVSGSGASPGR
ncbi:MAG: hypothetical protein AB1941_10780 [Gemmatimonadota bacterium]